MSNDYNANGLRGRRDRISGRAWGASMAIEVSYFSLASIIALALFLAIITPRSIFHLGRVMVSALARKPVQADGWLVGIALSILLCAGLGVATGLFTDRARSLMNSSEAVVLTFLFFAAPAVFQVLRAWTIGRTRKGGRWSHALVALAILSLPASMAIPTAALLQATASTAGQTGGAPSDNPAAGLANERYFTDSERVNDPEDYPIAAILQDDFSWTHTFAAAHGIRGENFYREIPIFTAFWFDQTANVLTFEVTDTFGVVISRISHVRANWGFCLAVLLYKLLCAVVLVAVTFDVIWRPLVSSVQKLSPHRSRG